MRSSSVANVTEFLCSLKQVAALWTALGTSLQMLLLIFPLFLPEGKSGYIRLDWQTNRVSKLKFRSCLQVTSIFFCHGFLSLIFVVLFYSLFV